jgi:AraC-like DNA-binding protein
MSEETVKKKNRGGRPKIELDKDQIRKLAELHCSLKEVAYVMGVSSDTIERNYRDVYEEGLAGGKIKLRRAMMRNACEKDNATIQIWLSKQLLGYSDNPVSDDDTTILPWDDK